LKKGSLRLVTIREVAKLAGVSQSTASRAFTGSGYASPETRERVLKAAKELGYTPHAIARSLRLHKSKTIGLMIGDIINPFYAQLADGVLEKANQEGYQVILSAHGEDPKRERKTLELFLEQRVAGILAVATGENIDLWNEVRKMGMKRVFIDRQIKGFFDDDCVLVDNVRGAYLMTKYLIQLGHRRIAIIIGPPMTTTGEGRLNGYYQAMNEAHIPIDPELVKVATFMRNSGRESIESFFDLENPPTALFTANNVLGEAAFLVIQQRGLSIPEDISLGIFDDVLWASLVTPSITVIYQPAFKMGSIGIQQLLSSLQSDKDENLKPVKVTIEPELIIRNSCRAINNRQDQV